ncbi:MAG: DNA-3-methyladenine glycosylase I [Pseudomonadales bacterium]|nr:DNA-3-methyladenine glycosylase I [Pseudomonadales bacterium]
MKQRCGWVNLDNPKYVTYHDEEWGVPVHDDQKLFEFLILEGAQAGLSWETILKKRSAYQQAFHHFEISKVAKMSDTELDALLIDSGIVKNKLKVYSTRKNAQAVLAIQKEIGSFDAYLWSFVENAPIKNEFKKLCLIPAQTSVSVALSKDLKKRGCNFVGPTIMYAFMQAVGMVNDHTTNCFRHTELM